MFTLAKQSKTSRGWFKGFPYAHPDPTLPAVIFNTQNELFKNRDVRWALALLIDIKAVSMASYRGAATISAIGVPPTGTHPDDLSRAAGGLAEGLRARHRQAQDQAVRPDRRQADRRHAAALAWATRSRPTPKEIAKSFGMGWWKPDPQAAQRAAASAPASPRSGDKWFTPDGKPFTVKLDGRGRGAAGDDARRLA